MLCKISLLELDKMTDENTRKLLALTMSSYPRELRRYSSKRGVAGSSLGADTEF